MNDARVRSRDDRLFLYDRRIAINVARATFQTWHDRLIAAGMFLIGLMIARSALEAQNFTMALWVGACAGAFAGLGAGRLVAGRLQFHAFDGPLAANALRPLSRRRYLLAWHAIGVAAAAGLTLIGRPSILIVTLPGYLAGAVAGHLIQSLDIANATLRGIWTGRDLRAWSRRPVAGVAAAGLLLISLALAGGTVRASALAAIAGIVTVACLITLTTIDARLVAFMRISGHKPWHIVGAHARGAASFAGIAVPACWIGFEAIVAATVGVLSAGALLLLSIRVLAYQLHSKRAADFMSSVLTGVLALTALVLPPAFPVIAIAVLWELQRRARTRVWLIA